MLFLFSEIENCGSGQTSYEREDYSSRSGDRYFVFADELPGLVAKVRRACEHRLVFEVPLDVQTERIGGRITAGGDFFSPPPFQPSQKSPKKNRKTPPPPPPGPGGPEGALPRGVFFQKKKG